jgi:hypothetical protein
MEWSIIRIREAVSSPGNLILEDLLYTCRRQPPTFG